MIAPRPHTSEGVVIPHVDVVTSVRIAAPRAAVATFAPDPGNATAWYANIKAVRWVTPPPAAVGSQVEFTARFLGRSLVYTYEVVEDVPGERFTMRTAQGPFPMRTTYTWQAAGPAETIMTLRNTGAASGFAGVAAPALAAAMRRTNTKDLQRLKALLETGV